MSLQENYLASAFNLVSRHPTLNVRVCHAAVGPPGPSAANYVAVDGPPGPSMAAMDGPPCRKWSPTSKLAQGG